MFWLLLKIGILIWFLWVVILVKVFCSLQFCSIRWLLWIRWESMVVFIEWVCSIVLIVGFQVYSWVCRRVFVEGFLFGFRLLLVRLVVSMLLKFNWFLCLFEMVSSVCCLFRCVEQLLLVVGDQLWLQRNWLVLMICWVSCLWLLFMFVFFVNGY